MFLFYNIAIKIIQFLFPMLTRFLLIQNYFKNVYA
jgi:hypothetical protein